jgi:tripartite-type tricarboxylate transporter receptor subunit TctC
MDSQRQTDAITSGESFKTGKSLISLHWLNATNYMKENRRKMLQASSQAISRREMIKHLGIVGGSAFLLHQAGCSQKERLQTSCSQLAGKQLHWLVPFPPGGGYDIYSRLIEPFYEKKTGAEIIIENTPGAGGLISANKLKESSPDGLTLGILNAPGLMVASLTGTANVPNPVTDFTILGRLVRNQVVWVTAGNSPLHSIEDVLAESRKRPIVFGLSEISSTTFTAMVVAIHLLGINAAYISGFAGSREISFAVMRGEVDIVALSFESVLDKLESQDLRAILQISPKRISPHASLNNVTLLCGTEGIATRRAGELGRNPLQTEEDAGALARLIGAGLLVAAPPNMENGLFRCLEQQLYETLTDTELQAAAAKANRSLDVGKADEALSDIKAASVQAEKFIPVIQAAIRKIRA